MTDKPFDVEKAATALLRSMVPIAEPRMVANVIRAAYEAGRQEMAEEAAAFLEERGFRNVPDDIRKLAAKG